MQRRFLHIVLLVRVAALFLVFGVGGVVLAAFLWPITRLFATRNRSKDEIAQRSISRAFEVFVRSGQKLGVWRLKVIGAERLKGSGTLVVANHPTLVDVVFLLSLLDQCDCVVKRAAWRNPTMFGIVRLAQYIPNDGGQQAIEACVERLRAGRNVLLFPEGTRSPAEGLRRFQRGAARVAIRSGCRVVPVFIDCDPPALKKGQPWVGFPEKGIDYTVRVGEPTRAGLFVSPDEKEATASRVFNRELRNLFEAQCAGSASVPGSGSVAGVG